jgi:hypothetical protein
VTLTSLVLAIWVQLGAHGPDQQRIAEAISAAVISEATPASGESHAVDAALLAVYAWHESGLNEHPRPQSWDAIAGLSRGVWQLRSYLVDGHSLTEQAQSWLWAMRRAGLGRGVDSSPSRAAKRLSEARAALAASL